MTLTKAQVTEQEQARETLRDLCPPGTRLYTVLRRVSQSGMHRHISVVLPYLDQPQRPTDQPAYMLFIAPPPTPRPAVQDITYLVARALDCKRDPDTGGLRVSGAGMDMGFEVVNSLSYALHGYKNSPNAYAVAGSDDRNGPLDAEAYRSGYTLKQEWL